MWLAMPEIAEAAQVTIDGTVNTSGPSHIHAGPQSVFISDSVGYKFYRDASGECSYAKTTDSGNTWGTSVLIDDRGNAVDCIAVAVWYDQWTPNATSGQQYIHVATMSSKDVQYNRLDTASSDTRLTGATAVSASTSTLQVGSYASGANYPSITKATDGTVYISADDTSDSFVVRCASACDVTTSWTEAGSRPQDLANDYSILVPLTLGHIMLINRDISLEDIRSKIWNSATWTAAWANIDTSADDNTTYDVGLAALVASSTSAATTTTYLVYTADNAALGASNDDIRTARYSNGAWATTTTPGSGMREVVSNDATKGITNVAIGMQKDTSNVYVAYNARVTPATANTANTYWKMSTTSMNSWSTESAAVSTSTDDFYGVDLNLISDQRMFVSWNGIALDDIFGDTIADLVPGVVVSTTTAQTTEVIASTTNFHVGTAFAFTESISTRDVTSIMIEENGTVDAENAITNIRLRYESDTTFPYNCASVSYNGNELQYGATSTGGFSGANGSSTFNGTASVSTTSALCVYPVMDILDSAVNDATLNIFMSNPSTGVTVSLDGEVGPTTTVDVAGVTTIKNDVLTQIHFHWRNDDGTETTATSRTASVQDTNLTSIQQSTPVRLRFEISNEGGTTSPAMRYRLEYSEATSTCAAAYLWTDVGAASDEWDMYNSSNLTDGADTTNIAAGANGAVTDENTSFVTPNAAVKDTSSQTGNITATSTQFIELEYSIVASTTAIEGNTYCFRLTNAGEELPVYTLHPRATIAADVSVTATSSQVSLFDVPTTTAYIGGAYVITENSGSRNVTDITITENGTVDGAVGIDNVRLRYDLDTSAPYDCSSESYSGSEPLFGNIDTDGFSGADGNSVFSDPGVNITTTQTMCVYTILDIAEGALNGEIVNVVISQPALDVVVTGGGSVSPSITRDITGSTTLRAAILTQMRYHWRSDTAPAEASSTSLTGGIEGTPEASLYDGTSARLRIAVSNEGATSTPSTRFLLEYGSKVTTCAAVASWIDVGAALGAWDMYDSPNMTNGGNTTDILIAAGGVTNENTTFKTPNGGLLDTSSLSASTTLLETQFIELEYSIEQMADAGFSSPYCFRVTKNGAPLEGGYSLYPELTTAPERDFKIQHGTTTVTGTGITLVAGVDYVAPSASTSAFMRITNTGYTGAGAIAGGTQNAKDVTAYIQNPWNIMTSVTIARPAAINNTRVSWEIVEFTGKAGSDNEIIVRQQEAVTYGAGVTNFYATCTAYTGTIADARDVVVFITGQFNPDTGTANYNSGQSTASWASSTKEAVFQRGTTGSDAAIVSFAAVEFTGRNWQVQRIEHLYTSTATATEAIAAVNATGKTFIHAQKRMTSTEVGNDEFGHEVWLSSVGLVSFVLQNGVTTPSGHTAVAWVVENLQSSTGAMTVTRSSGVLSGGTAPLTGYATTTISDPENASIFATNRSSLTTNTQPRPILGLLISTSTTNFQYWRSNIGSSLNFRAEVVEWPVAGTVVRQRDYQFFVDNNALLPTDAWPPGGGDIGENAPLGVDDQPLGGGERIRIRMSLSVINSSLPENSQAFKLQYGARGVSCSAVAAEDWFDVGEAGSTTALWNGYNATGTTDGTALSLTNPPTGGDLHLTDSDTAGTFEEENTSVNNPYRVEENGVVEYDWLIEQSGALASTTYCFRMVDSSGTILNHYADYPAIKTADFDPVTKNWRWYNDETNETPTVGLGIGENIAPIDIANADPLKLRVSVRERENVTQENTRFRLQFSEYSDFATSTYDVVATSTCTGSSTWCYSNGGGTDNEAISTSVLSDSDSCVIGIGRGCGAHTESTSTLSGFTQFASSTAEYEFTLLPDGARVNRTYYFRLYDMVRGAPVPLDIGESYPSLITEGAHLTLSTAGLATSTVIEGVTTDIATTPTRVAYGTLPPNTQVEAAQQFTVTTNASEGYQTLMYSDSDFLSSNGEYIASVNASNTLPGGWATVCDAEAHGCYGYHAGDDTLSEGSARFSPDDSYAGFETTPREIAYSSIPVTNDVVTVVYRVLARSLQPAGQYQTNVTFITLPSF